MKGILFTLGNVKAIQEGRKTVTRRAEASLKEINKEPDDWELMSFPELYEFQFKNLITKEIKILKPRYRVGETVYIKEAWATENQYNHLKPSEIPRTANIFYLLDGHYDPFTMGRVRSPLFMMEWMARDFRQITDRRAERLQLPLPPKELALEGGEEALPMLTLIDGKWVWRYVFQRVEK